jgi:hypothetical protein
MSISAMAARSSRAVAISRSSYSADYCVDFPPVSDFRASSMARFFKTIVDVSDGRNCHLLL